MLKLYWILLQQEMMEVVVVTARTLKRVRQITVTITNIHFFMCWMPFLLVTEL